MNRFICEEMIKNIQHKPREKPDFVRYFECELSRYIKEKKPVILSLLSLFLIQERWIKKYYEDTYYLFDSKEDKYHTLYYIIKDIHSDYENPKRLNNSVRYINQIILMYRDYLISDKIKKECYASLYRDIHHNLKIDGIQISDEETINKEIQKGTSLDQIKIEVKIPPS